MKPTFLSLVLLLASAIASQAALTFSLQFSAPIGGALTNIADEAGNTASGLSWGILIAESGSDFDTPFNVPLSLGVNTADGSEVASGVRYFAGGITTSLGFGTDQGPGVIDATGTINASPFEPAINTGDFFSLIWFERGFSSGDTLEVGTNYGILTNANFTVPSDGATNVPFGPNFNGPDPLRIANLTVVPEPSSLLLGSLGALFFLRRRTRKS